ncbi:MAG: peptidoglycan DD-metalloendopeptidase family protein [Turicibacter sp.]
MKKKVAGAIVATLLITNGPTDVEASNINVVTEQTVIYRVYVDEEVVGLITDLTQYDQFIEAKMKDLLNQYPDQVIYAPTNVRVEEEVTLLSPETIDNQAVFNIVNEKANFKTSATYVTIGDTKFATKDASNVQNTLLEVMSFYTGSENLQQIMDTTNPIQRLTTEGSQYVGAKIVEEVKVEDSFGAPQELLTPEQIRRMLLYRQKEPAQTYVFNEDSSLYYIARDFGLTEAELSLLNPGVENLKWSELLGLELDVTPLNPLITVETEQENVKIQTSGYETEYIDDETMLKGQTKVTQEGKSGETLIRTQLKYVNGQAGESVVVEETQLSEPVKEVIIRGTKVISGVGTGDWVWPTTTRKINNGYLGYAGHYALDIAATTGQAIYAADSGTVVSAGRDGAYGISILINHKNGYYTRYAHLSSADVSAGDKVEAGQTIGGAGNTGNSTGTHLHFEIRTNTSGQPTYAPNPMDFY